jgi:hypothetical protein
MAEIADLLKEKNISEVVLHSSFPFEISVGDEMDNSKITSKKDLAKRLEVVLVNAWIMNSFSGDVSVDTVNKQMFFTTREYNESGELESESSLVLDFLQQDDGGVKLVRMFTAG